MGLITRFKNLQHLEVSQN